MVCRYARTDASARLARRFRPLLTRLDARLTPSAGVEDVLSLPHLDGMSASYPADDLPGGYTYGPALDPAAIADNTPGGYSGDLAPVRLLDQPRARLAVATGAGTPTTVHLFDAGTGALLGTVTPFGPAFTGGARVAVGDLTGDGVPDLIAASGPGSASQVKVFDGKTLAEVASFAPYESGFTGGVSVAVGDVIGDVRAELLTAAGDGGGPLVKVFDPAAGYAETKSFFVFEEEFRGGATLAVGDVTGDGRAEIVTGAGTGGGPRVVATDLRTGERVQDFFAFDNGARGGVAVAVAAVDGKPTIATALLDGSGNQVRLFQGGYQVRMFTPFDAGDGKPQTRTPATVAFLPTDDAARPALAVATPAGQSPFVKLLDPLSGAERRGLPAVMPDQIGGLFVA